MSMCTVARSDQVKSKIIFTKKNICIRSSQVVNVALDEINFNIFRSLPFLCGIYGTV